MSTDSGSTDLLTSCETSVLAVSDPPSRCVLTPPPAKGGLTFETALALFRHTLERQERARPNIHGAMLRLADEPLITRTSQALQAAWSAGQRIWLTADLHLGHRNVISYCDRPFNDVPSMDQALMRQLGKVRADEWLVIVGDVAMGDHTLSFPLLRQVPGRKVLVVGNHDITRAGLCHYLAATADDGAPLFEAVVPFLFWSGHAGQQVVVSHYPLQLPEQSVPPPPDPVAPRSLPLLNYHGHLHRDLLPHSARIQYVNVGWDVTQGLLCL
ncbi:MAG: hypothetical protein EOP24_26840 [Hyphomicrobiales bacterium]|nr:MAG: hypothetical protein EOP24_26840 [Hyphomicrobiales bacterium]